MGQLPTVQQLNNEEYPEQQSWIDKLTFPINQFFKAVYANLDKGLTFGENFNGQVKELVFRDDDDYPIKFLSAIRGKVTDLVITKIQEDVSDPPAITNAVFPVWSYANGEIQIDDVIGLTSGTSYRMRVLYFGEVK